MASKEIPLKLGKVTIVDEADYDLLMQWKWRYSGGYARRGEYRGKISGKKKMKWFWMHRVIMGTPEGMDTDHINGEGLDNRRSNLRICTHAQNLYNQKKGKAPASSKYKGVHFFKSRPMPKPWVAQIKVNGKSVSLGYYKTEKEASIAYNEAAKKYFGEFMRSA